MHLFPLLKLIWRQSALRDMQYGNHVDIFAANVIEDAMSWSPSDAE